MFDSPYHFRKANTERPVTDKYLIQVHNYTFKVGMVQYMSKVEEYPNHLFIIKFFRKQDRKNRNRFSLLTNENRCTRIVATCIMILLSILKKNKLASFGFLGSHTVTNNYEELKNETKRFKIYKRAMENLIGEDVFLHSMDLAHSTYLMVNNNNADVDSFILFAREMFDDIYPSLSDW